MKNFMVAPEFQRARQPEQKEQRRADILRVAREMVEEEGVDGLSLNALARGVGLAKSNIYRYFESREAILLEVLRDDWREWIDEMVEGLSRVRGKRRVEKLAALVASSCAARPRMCTLVSAMSSVLEQNVSAETVRAFKLGAMEDGLRLAAAFQQVVPELSLEQHVELLRLGYSFIAGLWPSSNPPPVVQEVMQDPALAPLKHDFERDLERGVLLLARGLLA